MPRVSCRCGEVLKLEPNGPDRIVCPKCGAKIRVRRSPKLGDVDGFIRFACPCGRRLKVRAADGATTGKCPDCGRIVPVPSASDSIGPMDPEAATQELSIEEIARLDQWAQERMAKAGSATKKEAGLRVCPKCGRPVHLSAIVCGECGAAVPKR
jgi:DNA-directed RNA polymerase subunit M/transcription elongation factor TFIIS